MIPDREATPKVPKPPKGLDAAGTALWNQILAVYWMDTEAGKLALLEQACKVADRIAELERAMVGQPYTVLGSARQVVINPLVPEERQLRGLLASMLKGLQLPEHDGEAVEQEKAKTRTQNARHAANVRWGKVPR